MSSISCSFPRATRRGFLAGSLATGLSACAPRGALGLRPDLADLGTTRRVWAVALGEQKPVALHGDALLERKTVSRFARFDVSIPAERLVGEIDWPGSRIDPDQHFFVSGLSEMNALEPLLEQVDRDLRPGEDVTVFVHGYNTNYAEAVYRHAQIAHDFQNTGPQITLIWPSEASPTGYLTDRDTVLTARDQLEDFLLKITRRFPGRVVIAAHSMGAFLTMETLRQMSLAGRSVTGKLAALVLVSPDIRIDVFQSQVARIGALPEITVLIISQRDRVLQVSSRLAGGKPRLGSASDIALLSGMDLLVVDLSDLPNAGRGNHLAATTSPAAVAFIRALASSASELEERRREGLLVLRVPLPIPR